MLRVKITAQPYRHGFSKRRLRDFRISTIDLIRSPHRNRDRPHWDEIVRWVIVKPYETGINAASVVIRGAVSNGGGNVPGQAPTSAMESSYTQTKPSGDYVVCGV